MLTYSIAQVLTKHNQTDAMLKAQIETCTKEKLMTKKLKFLHFSSSLKNRQTEEQNDR